MTKPITRYTQKQWGDLDEAFLGEWVRVEDVYNRLKGILGDSQNPYDPLAIFLEELED